MASLHLVNVLFVFGVINGSGKIWRPVRFRKFYLDVSNSSASNSSYEERLRCYTDYTTFPNYPSNITDIKCTQTARYIIVQTEYSANDTWSTGPVLEICEIEVYGCIKGFWGENCNKTCSTHCLGENCNPENGKCLYGCQQNFAGNKCEECRQTHYGPRCDQLCSPSCLNGTCFSNNGSCKYDRNANFNEDNSIQETHQSAESNLQRKIYSTLYGIITFFIISVFLNIFLFVRNVRQTIYRREISKKVKIHQNSTRAANPVVDDREEDNAGYQELGQLSQPSHYDEVKVRLPEDMSLDVAFLSKEKGNNMLLSSFL